MEDINNKKLIFVKIKGWVYPIVIALMIAGSFKSAIADWNTVPTGSMKPTIVEGDRVLINKLAYDLKIPFTTKHIAEWGEPQRGEIVVFYSPAGSKRLIKRVVGLPGDTIALEDNKLFINGKAIEYEPAKNPDPDATAGGGSGGGYYLEEDLQGRKHIVMLNPDISSRRSFSPVTIPSGYYFMMGDNRDNSADSRYFGLVERHRIVGRAMDIVISLDINNMYRPRWERFFSRLN
jgi:signal peptidase I